MDEKRVLKDLEEVVERVEERRRRDERQSEMRRKQTEKEEEMFWEEESRKMKEKLEMTEEIFRWGREFSQSDLYKRLDALGYGLTSYRSFWGHRRNGRNFGCNSELHLMKDGTFFYTTTYKWMNGGGIPAVTFERPEEMAERLTYDYIKELYERIKSGEIYERILQKLVKEYL